jgi:hypothetical protein
MLAESVFRCRSGRISLAGNHLAQVWQVGEGVSPALDALGNVCERKVYSMPA